MKRSSISLFAASALVALMFNPLVAGNQKSGDQRSGPMVIPIYGTESDEVVFGVDEYVFDGEGNLIGIRGLQLGVTQTINIPMLGIKDWVLPLFGSVDIEFGDGDPYLLRFSSHGKAIVDGENVWLTGGSGFHRMTSETMTEKYVTNSGVFVSGPLTGVVITTIAHTTEPLENPPEYASTFTGFLYVPAHVDLEDLKNQGKRFGSLNK